MLQTNNVTEPATEYELKPTAKQIHIPIDDDTKLFTRAMHHFTDVNGTEYLTIENTETADDYYYINFYRLDSCKLSHKVKIAKEGPNGIPNKSLKGTISEKEAQCMKFQVWDYVPLVEIYGLPAFPRWRSTPRCANSSRARAPSPLFWATGDSPAPPVSR